MAQNKTKQHNGGVKEFLASVKSDTRRSDARIVMSLLSEITGKRARMWGPSIIGYGKYHYRYDSGHEGDMCLIGFSPRSNSLVFYITTKFTGYSALISVLGKHKSSKACLYINKLADVDLKVLKKILKGSYKAYVKKTA